MKPSMRVSRAALLRPLLASAWLLAGSAAIAQESTTDDLSAQSLPLRTALHHDPTLVSPLERLLSIYRGANRADELIGVYRAHVAQYPTDFSGRTVLVRLLASSGNPEALRAARAAVGQFPQNAYLHYALFELLRAQYDADALGALDKAIELENQASRKVVWIDLLLPAAMAEGRRDLVEKHLGTLAAITDDAQQRLQVAQRMIEYKFFGPALKLLQKKDAEPAAPETMVSIELAAAAAEVALDRSEAAGARLDRLLQKLTADYWRRGEIVQRRLALVNSQAQRDAMIGAARKRAALSGKHGQNPRDEAALLDLAGVLAGLQLRRDALEVLLEAGRRLPQSAPIEKRTLDLLDQLHDLHGREAYLARRIRLFQKQPRRADLVLMHVRTLYLLGRSGDALAALTEAVDEMKPDDRGGCLLETARFLRRSALLGDAAELFRRAIEAAPARLPNSRVKPRRELAETYLAMGDRQRVRELFGEIDFQQASLEDLLDLVQFMIRQELLGEARAALRGRLAQEKVNLDLYTLLLGVERRLGHHAAGEKLIARSRPLADTGARYRLWLEAAVEFHEASDSIDSWLAAEQARLDEDPGPWTTRRLERRLAWAEISARCGRRQEAAAMLQHDLDDDPPPGPQYAGARIKLRRQLVGILEKQSGRAAEVRQELEELAKEDRQHSDEHLARLALLHAKDQREDLAMGLLGKIEVSRIQDPALLGALRPLWARHPEGQQQTLKILQRLTVLDPTDRANWQQWLTALAITGDETRLRSALRRLLAGHDPKRDWGLGISDSPHNPIPNPQSPIPYPQMPLADETRWLLQSHVADSYWRSIARCLAQPQVVGGDSVGDCLLSRDLADGVASHKRIDALVLLDAVERMAQSDQQWLWVTWIRAHVLGRLGRQEARDEAIAELKRVAAEIVDSPEEPFQENASVLRIALPDGLSVSFDHARELLVAPAPAAATRCGPRQGPSPPLELKWAFATDAAATITAIVPLGPDRTLICDRLGGGHCVEASGGKLIWEIEGLLPVVPLGPDDSRSANPGPVVPELPPTPLADAAERFFVPDVSQVACHSAGDGRLLWRADVATAGASRPITPSPIALPHVSLFLYEDDLLTYDPASATVTRIDPDTGKIVRDWTLSSEQPVLATCRNSGASLCGHRLLIYGVRTAVVDVETGELLWSFEPWQVRGFPVTLRDPSVDGAPALTFVPSGGSYGGPGGQPTQYLSYLQTNSFSGSPPGGVSLTGPAVLWASNLRQGTPGRAELMDRRLLLFDSSGLQIVPTDLPLAGKRVSVDGQPVGMAGRIACLVSGNRLQFVDVTSGTVKSYDFREVASAVTSFPGSGPTADVAAPPRQPIPIQTAIDGPMVYVSGPGGIVCVNAITARRAFRADWPAEVAPPPNVVNPNVPGVHLPTIGRVDRGVLYVLVAPNRVVALRGSDSLECGDLSPLSFSGRFPVARVIRPGERLERESDDKSSHSKVVSSQPLTEHQIDGQ